MKGWLKEVTYNIMSNIEAAWLAGFFDGEGTIGSYKTNRSSINKIILGWRLAIPNTHLGALEYSQKITGIGIISSKSTQCNSLARKPQWVWKINNQRGIAAISKQMLPYLLIKREAVEDFLFQCPNA